MMTHEVRPPQVLRCPKCGFDYIKIESMNIRMGPGLLILAEYGCEGCPGGTLRIDFHKGQTFIEEA